MGDNPRFITPWANILQIWYVFELHKPIDEFTSYVVSHIGPLKHLFLQGTYIEVFEFLEFVMQFAGCPSDFADTIKEALKRARAAYTVVDKKVIFPTATEEEAKSIVRAFESLKGNSFAGARSHLLKAGEELNKGNYANSIRESIHAVESISRAIVPGTKKLDKALESLETQGHLHGALKEGFSSIYGFTSDEQGIRHPLLNTDEAEVDQEIAVFMLGACASFVSYLANKGRQAELIVEDKTS